MSLSCQIKSHLGGGLYNVDIFHDTAYLTAAETALTDWITSQETLDKLGELQNALAVELSKLTVLQSELNMEIDYLNVLTYGSEEYEKQLKLVKQYTDAALEQRAKWLVAEKQYQEFTAYYDAKVVARNTLQSTLAVPVENRNVWCCDLSDGIDGRYIYPVDAIVTLWCLNYDPATAFLPPGNTAITFIETEYANLENPNNGVFNMMRHFANKISPSATFWNAAMEPGFAIWMPWFRKAIMKQPNGTNGCGGTGGVSQLTLTKTELRFGNHLDLPEVDIAIKIDYFQRSAFSPYEEVIVRIDSIKPKLALAKAGYDVTGTVIGFIDNPKAGKPDDGGCDRGFPSMSTTPYILTKNWDEEVSYEGSETGFAKYDEIIPEGAAINSFKQISRSKKSKITARNDDNTIYKVLASGGCTWSVSYHAGEHYLVRELLNDGNNHRTHLISDEQRQHYYEIGGVYIPDYSVKLDYEYRDVGGLVKYNREVIELLQITGINYADGSYSYIERRIVTTATQTFKLETLTETDITVDCSGEETRDILTQSSNPNVTIPFYDLTNPDSTYGDNTILLPEPGSYLYGSYVPASTPENPEIDIKFSQQTSNTIILPQTLDVPSTFLPT